MIRLTRLGGQQFVLNDELIERLEATPDTVITLVNDRIYVVSETPDEVLLRVADARAGGAEPTDRSRHPRRGVLRLVSDPDDS